jgi:hypothetical protein
MSDRCAVYSTKDNSCDDTIFIIITHETVFSYFVSSGEFHVLHGDAANRWLENNINSNWWKKLA